MGNVEVRVRSKGCFWARMYVVFTFLRISSRIISSGTTRGPHHIPQVPYCILDKNNDPT